MLKKKKVGISASKPRVKPVTASVPAAKATATATVSKPKSKPKQTPAATAAAQEETTSERTTVTKKKRNIFTPAGVAPPKSPPSTSPTPSKTLPTPPPTTTPKNFTSSYAKKNSPPLPPSPQLTKQPERLSTAPKRPPSTSTRKSKFNAFKGSNNTNPNSNSDSPDKTEIAGSRLHIRAKQQQAKIKQLQAEKPRNCTFAPQFITSKNSRGSQSHDLGNFLGTMTQSAAGQDRFDCLYKNAQDISEKIAHKAQKKQMEPPGCSFAPKFSTTQHRVMNKSNKINCKVESGEKRFENLFNDAKKIKEKIDLIKEEEASQISDFRPQITSRGQKILKHKPAASQNFTKRLYKDENATVKKFSGLEGRKKEIELEGCTFQPKTFVKKRRSTSAPKSRPSWAGANNNDVSSRLHSYQASVAAHKAHLVEEEEERVEKITPFKPQLQTKKYNAAHVKIERNKESTLNRLVYAGGSEEKSAKRAALLREERKQCTFKPSIPKRRSTR